MLAAWPFICLLLFMWLPQRQALLASVLGGYLLLPSATRFDLQGLPDLDKAAMIAIGSVLGALLIARKSIRPGGALITYGLGSAFVLSPFVTGMLNPDPIVGQRLFFPGLNWYDSLSQAGVHLFSLLPFWAGRRLLADEAGHKTILLGTVVAMLLYSVLILIEIRLSPQLHRWVYGFFPHSFAQQFRGGGFRAVVFLNHGLVVALFLGLALIAAIARYGTRGTLFGVQNRLWVFYLVLVLLLQKSLGAAVTGLLFGGAVIFLSPKKQLGLASVVALLVTMYPLARGGNLLPIETLQGVASSISADRADSLNTRLSNEERLLTKANQRPLFGWGGWGRNRVYDLEDGRDLSITDGTWISVMGSYGWVGFLAMFGLLALPVLRLRVVFRRARSVPPATAAVALMLMYNMVDLIPNSSLTPFTWLLAGSLLSRRPAPVAAAVTQEAGAPGDPQVPAETGLTPA